MTYKTRGIVIKRTNLGEADRILTIFTEKFGKIKAVAKGARKTLSKLAGNLELFCLDEFLIAEGRNLDIVAGAEVRKCYFNLRNDLRGTQIAFYLAEIIDKMTEEKEPHPEIFDLIENTLENINSHENNILISYFEINFLSESGFNPELYKCIVCGKKLEESSCGFNYSAGGLVCQNCHKDIKVSSNAVKILRIFLKHKIAIIKKLKPDKKLSKEITKITRDYLKTILQKEIKSESYI